MKVDADVFWTVVHERLDARKDPLTDPAIVEALVAHPERAEALVSMLRALDAVRSLPIEAGFTPRSSRPALARRCAAAAVILGALGLGYYATRRAEIAPPPRLGPRIVVRAFPPGTMPVASWTVSVVRREGEVSTQDSVGSSGPAISDLSASKRDSDFARVTFLRSTRLP